MLSSYQAKQVKLSFFALKKETREKFWRAYKAKEPIALGVVLTLLGFDDMDGGCGDCYAKVMGTAKSVADVILN